MAAFDWSAVGRVLDQITSAMSELARQVGEVVAVAVEYIMAADIPGAVARMESHARKVRRAVTVVNMDC
jgi:phenylpyruvate tautomerase PptA (4-oxalocrotonate tautomerase family)